jgi:hypothetical protein
MWTKLGDFKHTTRGMGLLNHNCIYYSDDSKYKKIELRRYLTTKEQSFWFIVQMRSEEETNDLIGILKQHFFDKASKKAHKIIECENNDTINFNPFNREQMALFFKLLANFDPSVKEILSEIMDDLDLYETKEDLLEIPELCSEKAIAMALEAQDKGFFDVPWNLAERYWQDSLDEKPKYSFTDQQLGDLLEGISKKSPHYIKAQDRLLDLLLRIEPDDQERRTHSKILFGQALKSTNQLLIDQMFNDLCGNPFSTEIIHNIKTDDETLTKLAEKIMEMNLEIAKLRTMNQELIKLNQTRNEKSELNNHSIFSLGS